MPSVFTADAVVLLSQTQPDAFTADAVVLCLLPSLLMLLLPLLISPLLYQRGVLLVAPRVLISNSAGDHELINYPRLSGHSVRLARPCLCEKF